MECAHLEENAMITAANIHVEAVSRRCSGWLPEKHILNLTLLVHFWHGYVCPKNSLQMLLFSFFFFKCI